MYIIQLELYRTIVLYYIQDIDSDVRIIIIIIISNCTYLW